jgi:amidophosphoribosyltransferase
MNDDRFHEACGVFGIYAPGCDAARQTFFGIYALQHRGQESAGIATSDGLSIMSHKALGLVTDAFTEPILTQLHGHSAIGHTRYSTTGGSGLANAQPLVMETYLGPIALAHNGNLTNTAQLRRSLLHHGVGLQTTTDSEVAALTLLASGADDWGDCFSHLVRVAQGAYCLVLLTNQGLYAIRDPLGFRPLCLGQIGDQGWVVASESCALSTVGATWVREIAPGELVRIDADGPRTLAHFDAPRSAFCIFEYIYFARPDSSFHGQVIHQVRMEMGRQLAREAPAAADVVVGVPDSALPAAMGYAEQAQLPYVEGLIKNRYSTRTFIQPNQQQRKQGVLLKFSPLCSGIEGKRVILVDDSVVRGTTSSALVAALRRAGAKEVHLRVASPAVRHPCFMGIDMASYSELIAHRLSEAEIADALNVETLKYLSHAGLMRAIGRDRDAFCSACFTGDYPIPVPLPTLQDVIALTPIQRMPATAGNVCNHTYRRRLEGEAL